MGGTQEGPQKGGNSDFPSNETIVRFAGYLLVVIVLGVSFSESLAVMNTAFLVGVVGTIINIGLSGLFVRYILKTHFSPESDS